MNTAMLVLAAAFGAIGGLAGCAIYRRLVSKGE